MTATQEEREARLVLSLVFEPGDPRVGDLVARFGAVAAVELLRSHLLTADVLTDTAHRLAAVRADPVLDHGAQVGARFIVPGDEEWPPGLDDLAHAGQVAQRGGVPVGLWVKGQRLETMPQRVAIVGSRAATTYGTSAAGSISATCVAAGWTVVSGGAYGIDIVAHRAAMASGGRTVVALAHGLDRIYPVGNTAAIEAAVRTGALVSELAPGTAPMRLRFLARNRVIAALGAGTVVVEAGARSGALNTAGWAGRLSRPVMAVPGPITSAASTGCHELIRSGAAVLVGSGGDVLEVVAGVGEHAISPPRGPRRVRDELDLRHHQVLEAVPVARPAGPGRIAGVAGVGEAEVLHILQELAAAELVVEEPGGWRLASRAR